MPRFIELTAKQSKATVQVVIEWIVAIVPDGGSCTVAFSGAPPLAVLESASLVRALAEAADVAPQPAADPYAHWTPYDGTNAPDKEETVMVHTSIGDTPAPVKSGDVDWTVSGNPGQPLAFLVLRN